MIRICPEQHASLDAANWRCPWCEIERLCSRVEELEQDAARYRWLREESVRVDPLASVTIKRYHDRNESNWVNVAVLDAAVDAAMREEQE